ARPRRPAPPLQTTPPLCPPPPRTWSVPLDAICSSPITLKRYAISSRHAFALKLVMPGDCLYVPDMAAPASARKAGIATVVIAAPFGGSVRNIPTALSLALLPLPLLAQGAPPQVGADQPYTMEYYYKLPWGRQQEFLQLFLKNHYPLLQKGVES